MQCKAQRVRPQPVGIDREAVSRRAASFARTTFHRRSIKTAGKGSCEASTRSNALIAGAGSEGVNELVPHVGVKPAATSRRLRSRSGMSSAAARCSSHLPARRRLAGLQAPQVPRRHGNRCK